MKKLFLWTALLCVALTGCEYDDSEVRQRLDGLEDRVDALEKAIGALNANVGTLQSLVDGKLFITSVTENPEGGGVYAYAGDVRRRGVANRHQGR